MHVKEKGLKIKKLKTLQTNKCVLQHKKVLLKNYYFSGNNFSQS